MAKSLYTAGAHVVGGRDQGHGVTSDGVLDVELRTPVEMGGKAEAPTLATDHSGRPRGQARGPAQSE
jgi:organic hydroperoxide reductase OsmC/OhrA